jgi:uncharacterized membrane protein
MVKVVFSVLSLFYPILVLAVLRFFGGNYLGSLLKLYPLLINLALLVSFGTSLFNPPTKVFRIALLSDSSIRNSANLPDIESYCRGVTKVWCIFFALNALASSITILYSPDWVWALYNGLIAYILMGIIFAVEWLVRKKVKKGLR